MLLKNKDKEKNLKISQREKSIILKKQQQHWHLSSQKKSEYNKWQLQSVKEKCWPRILCPVKISSPNYIQKRHFHTHNTRKCIPIRLNTKWNTEGHSLDWSKIISDEVTEMREETATDKVNTGINLNLKVNM